MVLVGWCGYDLELALDAIQDGVTILHGTQEMAQPPWPFASPDMEPLLHEFYFAGETWCGGSIEGL